jgi:glutamate racemase
MDHRPIGVFDSGLGGLTTVKKLCEYLPGEDIIYLGDTGRVPYGSRSKETIIKYAKQDAAFLARQEIKAMVVACNTVSSMAFGLLDSLYDMPVFEVISAPAEAAAKSTKNGKIGIIGTSATIRSGAYETRLKEISKDLNVLSGACPLFVPMAEYGRTDENDIAALTIARDYLADFCESGIDTLIMGCTHYPLLHGVISKVMGSGTTLIDSGAETAKRTAEVLREQDLLSSAKQKGSVKYFITDSIEDFSTLASRFLNSPVEGMVEQVVLE